MSRGWPGPPAIRDLSQPAPPGRPMWADRELRYALLPASQLIAEVRYDIDEMIQTGDDQVFLVSGPLSARLRRDPEAVHAFEDSPDARNHPNTKAGTPSAPFIGRAGLASKTTSQAG